MCFPIPRFVWGFPPLVLRGARRVRGTRCARVGRSAHVNEHCYLAWNVWGFPSFGFEASFGVRAMRGWAVRPMQTNIVTLHAMFGVFPPSGLKRRSGDALCADGPFGPCKRTFVSLHAILLSGFIVASSGRGTRCARVGRGPCKRPLQACQ